MNAPSHGGAPAHLGPLAPPSDWVLRWAHLLTPGTQVLDVACGRGRHARWLAERGCAVTGVDRDADAVAALPAPVEGIVADLEGAPWPLGARQFDAVLVTNYLWRALWPELCRAVAPGGWLLYETFAVGHEALGRPSRPEFLLRRGELLEVCREQGLDVVAFEAGRLAEPERIVQRVVAQRPHAHRALAAPALR